MKISQREARKMKQELEALRARENSRFSRWGSDYPGGTHFLTLTVSESAAYAIRTAQTLQHAVVVRIGSNTNDVRLYALPPPSPT
jgi:histidinol-phosphate/aromatic aminotransferase/cobyric acid decarboxylase-like protein